MIAREREREREGDSDRDREGWRDKQVINKATDRQTKRVLMIKHIVGILTECCTIFIALKINK